MPSIKIFVLDSKLSFLSNDIIFDGDREEINRYTHTHTREVRVSLQMIIVPSSHTTCFRPRLMDSTGMFRIY